MQKSIPRAKMLIILAMSMTVVFSSCKKDKDEVPKSKTDLLTISKWKMTARTVTPEVPFYDDEGNSLGMTNDLFAQMYACEKDNSYKFNKDFTIIIDEEAVKCMDSRPQTHTGSWSFKSNESGITVSAYGDHDDYTIAELTETTLKLQYTYSGDSKTYTVTQTYSH